MPLQTSTGPPVGTIGGLPVGTIEGAPANAVVPSGTVVADRRTSQDYAGQWVQLFPQGTAWPRNPASVFFNFLLGLSGIWGSSDTSTVSVDGRAGDLYERESDPRTTVELLPDWERAFGLPDLCLAEPLTIGDRQKALTARVGMTGGQSRAWFIAYAAQIGYQIEIIEHAPFMCGVSQCGDTTGWNGESLSGPRWEITDDPTIRWYWTVAPLNIRLTWFRCGGGGGQCGVDPMLIIGQATDLECSFQRYKPAHTVITFAYGGAEPFNPMSGTP
jgi:uncharacterized protein YmfQ (DUF2313 family)